ncbi:hypothetical protein Vafri_5285 [Volvox africanus]|uniref:Uncharacterized protein n=2 Tax=Volvox africanus TaxID=51714 RepID=A0A8J4AW91_9CHLO|nr:hypothetical protein Vafri_5285 [Volvox africanus]
MIRGKTFLCGLVLVLAVAASIAVSRPRIREMLIGIPSPMMGCSMGDTTDTAYRTDLRFLSRLGSGTTLMKLTDGGESALEVLSNLDKYQALVIVTAGRSKLTRRSENQPFISISADGLGKSELHQPDLQPEQEDGEGESIKPRRSLLFGDPDHGEDEVGWGGATISSGSAPAYGSGLAELAYVVDYMNAAAVRVEGLIRRRLFPITISLFDRTAGGTVSSGPYAIFDASAGALLLDRQFLSSTWGNDKPQVSYIARQLATRVFTLVAEMLPTMASESDGKQSAARSAEDSAAANERKLFVTSAADSNGDGGGGGGGGATSAVGIVAAALAVALPAAFAAAPPLWFCILCPSVLGLLAPLVINLALNQVAGLLCSQLHLTDDVCFDVLLGALGAGFVLSLASAVPIFFLCRLPECAGRNVTTALMQLLLPRAAGGLTGAAGIGAFAELRAI